MSKSLDTKNSKGQQMIITGLTHLVENEGYSELEATRMARTISNHIYFALADLRRERNEKR